MNQHLQNILTFFQDSTHLTPEEQAGMLKLIKAVDKDLEIAIFKLDRTEKIKKTTAILLEETIEELEQKRKAIEETNEALRKSLADLKAAQSQLIQSEKMASLGELTAGIAHEIQNPLNFVNNFSEVSHELLDEMKEELERNNPDEAIAIAQDIKQNLEKILHHGRRADGIVKGMLQHSRSSNGVKEPTDINALTDEYLRLAYHGLRAKDKSFNATITTDFAPGIGLINVIPQDIGRVLLNLITNAFHAVSEHQKMISKTPYPLKGGVDYTPIVLVKTLKQLPLSGGRGSDESKKHLPLSDRVSEESRDTGNIEISVTDNGPGIPKEILDKIYQPFFTTKPTGQGTGLGLSISYDIIKAQGGELALETKEGVGTTFTIRLPMETY